MARSSQTRTAVLGALTVEPMTGYALRAVIRDVLGHFWSESFGQIYPALAELEREGLVERTGSPRTGSSTFALTAAGREELRALLGRPVQRVPPRNGLLLRLYFGRTLGAAACRELLLDARAEAQAQLTALDAAAAEVAAEREHTADAPYWGLTVSAGRHSARAALAWVEESLAALDALDADGEEGAR